MGVAPVARVAVSARLPEDLYLQMAGESKREGFSIGYLIELAVKERYARNVDPEEVLP